MPPDADSTDEAALVERATNGDPIAMDELIERHRPALEAFVRLRAGEILLDRESTSDLVQSACREVLAHADRFRYGGERGFKAWLYETALRKIRNRLDYWGAEKRRGDPAPLVEDVDEMRPVFGAFASPSRDADAREQMVKLEQAMTSLSEEQRQVVVYSRLIGLSHTEIAQIIGKSEASSRAILCRALAQLSELLG